jgi:serine/threonine protein kinase
MGFRLKDGFYELEAVLGRGGFGITYLARHTGLGTKIALKELYPDHLVFRDSSGNIRAQAGMQPEFENLKLRFSREAKTLRELKHRASTKFISDWHEHGTVFIAMEFIDGETLEARIARGALLTEREAREVMIPILELLEEVHGRGLLHRDIKPANIIVTKTGGVELIDFGSVTNFSTAGRTKVTSRLLTPAYAPLEQYGQEVMLTPSTDLYALAATMYEAITGIAPVPALDRANGKKLESIQTLALHVTPEFSSMLMKALELRMEDRFSSAESFASSVQVDLSPQSIQKSPINLKKSQSSNVLQLLHRQINYKESLLIFAASVPITVIVILSIINFQSNPQERKIRQYSLEYSIFANNILRQMNDTHLSSYKYTVESIILELENTCRNYNFAFFTNNFLDLQSILPIQKPENYNCSIQESKSDKNHLDVYVYGFLYKNLAGYSVNGNPIVRYF